jgi:hypothetical protein
MSLNCRVGIDPLPCNMDTSPVEPGDLKFIFMDDRGQRKGSLFDEAVP